MFVKFSSPIENMVKNSMRKFVRELIFLDRYVNPSIYIVNEEKCGEIPEREKRRGCLMRIKYVAPPKQ